jgi:hypothetical protein
MVRAGPDERLGGPDRRDASPPRFAAGIQTLLYEAERFAAGLPGPSGRYGDEPISQWLQL